MTITSYMNSDANPTTSSFFTNNEFPGAVALPMTYTTENGYWIYCNNPEQLPKDAFGDSTLGNKCLNRVVVPAGTHELFYSYQYNQDATTEEPQYAKTPFTFGIRIFNGNSSAIKFKKYKYGSCCNESGTATWADVPKESFSNYVTSTSDDIVTIPANGVHWITESVPNNSSLISGMLRFYVSKLATVTVYVYQNTIDGDETVYPNFNTDSQFSGYHENGNRMIANTITLKASELKAAPRFFYANYTMNNMFNINGIAKNTDLLPIKLSYNNTTTTNNLGNWGLIYKIPVSINNDTSKTIMFKGYVHTDVGYDYRNSIEYPLIWDGVSKVTCGHISNSANENGYKNTWRWLTMSVPAGTTRTFDYYYVLGTNSYAGKRHYFTAE